MNLNYRQLICQEPGCGAKFLSVRSDTKRCQSCRDKTQTRSEKLAHITKNKNQKVCKRGHVYDRLDGRCLKCRREKDRKYHADNRDKINENRRNRRKALRTPKDNKPVESRSEKDKRYYLENREEINEFRRKKRIALKEAGVKQ